MHVPFIVREPAVLLCAAAALFFVLRALSFMLRYPAFSGSRRDGQLFLIASGSLLGAIVCNWVANAEGAMIGMRYDLYVYRVDQLLGGEPAAALGRILLSHAWSVWTINFIYGLLPAAVMFLLLAYEPNARFREVLFALLLNFALAPLLYAAIPVSGPRFAFPQFPVMPIFTAPHIIHLHDPPNGVPSVHFSTALLIWWYARRWRFGDLLSVAFVALTAVATLASGQHYLFDLIAAVPYCIGITMLARTQSTMKQRLRVTGEARTA